jgi:hypothetical protein
VDGVELRVTYGTDTTPCHRVPLHKKFWFDAVTVSNNFAAISTTNTFDPARISADAACWRKTMPSNQSIYSVF